MRIDEVNILLSDYKGQPKCHEGEDAEWDGDNDNNNDNNDVELLWWQFLPGDDNNDVEYDDNLL